MAFDLYNTFFIVGIFLLMLAYFTFRNTKKILRHGILVLGTVVRFQSSKNEGSKDRYFPIIEYQDQQYVRRQHKSKIDYQDGYYLKGEQVKLILNPEDNTDVRVVNYLNLHWKTLLLLSIASIGLIIGGGHFLYSI